MGVFDNLIEGIQATDELARGAAKKGLGTRTKSWYINHWGHQISPNHSSDLCLAFLAQTPEAMILGGGSKIFIVGLDCKLFTATKPSSWTNSKQPKVFLGVGALLDTSRPHGAKTVSVLSVEFFPQVTI